jgi:hypothetical protein
MKGVGSLEFDYCGRVLKDIDSCRDGTMGGGGGWRA